MHDSAGQQPQIIYRTASSRDLLAAGSIYLRAFPDSVRALRSPHLTPLAVADLLRAPLAADPGCITAAEAGAGQLVGYVIAPRDAGKIASTTLRTGLLLAWLWRWVTGRYRLSPWGALRISLDKIHTGGAWRIPGGDCPARVISIAVDLAWQGRGIGRALLTTALARLHGLGVARVRLEVRPQNAAARHLYESMGFAEIGGFSDSRGPWLVMVGATSPKAES